MSIHLKMCDECLHLLIKCFICASLYTTVTDAYHTNDYKNDCNENCKHHTSYTTSRETTYDSNNRENVIISYGVWSYVGQV